MNESRHLDAILDDRGGKSDVQVVFADIEKYSKRTSAVQREIVDAFTEIIRGARTSIARTHRNDLKKNGIDLTKDLLLIPTGDGVAAIFSFAGLVQIHLDFAEALMKLVTDHNAKEKCSVFSRKGWCDCHNIFNINIGIGQGPGVFYHDVNGQPNLAGKTINYAARVLGFGDRMHVLLTREAYDTLSEYSRNTDFKNNYRNYEDVEIKHGDKITVYQYIPKMDGVINRDEPEKLKSKIANVRLNPGLKIIKHNESYSIGESNRYTLVRTVEATVLADNVNSYVHRFNWTGNGKVSPSITKKGFRIDHRPDMDSCYTVCTVYFDRAKNKGESLKFSYKIELDDSAKSARPFLAVTISTEISEELKLVVALPIIDADRQYYQRIYTSRVAPSPIFEEPLVLYSGESVIQWGITKPILYQRYVIDWSSDR